MGEVLRCPYGYALWSTFFFVKFTHRLSEFYPELFEGGGASSEHQANFTKKWSAYSTIFELANGDILKFDEVIEQPLEKCLLYLSFRADRIQLDELQHKQAMSSIRQ